MLIYVHIKNENEIDSDMIPIECDSLPAKGESILLSDEDKALLEWKAINCIACYIDYIYGYNDTTEEDHWIYYLDFEGVEIVDEVLWLKEKDGKYHPHIFLRSFEEREEETLIDYEMLTDEFCLQIRNTFLEEHPTFKNNQ